MAPSKGEQGHDLQAPARPMLERHRPAMTPKICLRCDWQGETDEPRCPNCGGRSLFVVGAPPSKGEETRVRNDPEDRSPGLEASITAAVARSGAPSREPSPSPAPADAEEPPGRSARSVAAFVLTALVLTVMLGTWLKANDEPSAAAKPSGSPVTQTPSSDVSPSPTPVGTHELTVGGVPFSFEPRGGWERFGGISINKSDPFAADGQDAEAIIFWTTFPQGDIADPCDHLLRSVRGPSAAELAAAVAAAPGTELVSGPSYVSVGGQPATHVVLTVQKDLGCDPGYFFTWNAVFGGAFWLRTGVGDTIRVWIVEVDGKRLVIGAETVRQASPGLEQEIQQIIGSIRFD